MANPIIISKQAGTGKNFTFVNKTFLNNLVGQAAKTKIYQSSLKNIISDTPSHISYLGTPVYDSVTIGDLDDRNKNKYFDLLGNEISFSPIRFDDVLLDVSLVKNIVSTPIQGRNNTIKQYISDGDFNIMITGRISGKWDGQSWNMNGQYYPEFELKILADICKAGYSLPIESKFLNNIFSVDKIVISDYKMTQIEGGRYSQSFELNCMSDEDVILEFTEEDVSNDETLSDILNV